jgi:hypothetical protein
MFYIQNQVDATRGGDKWEQRSQTKDGARWQAVDHHDRRHLPIATGVAAVESVKKVATVRRLEVASAPVASEVLVCVPTSANVTPVNAD